MSLTIDDDPQAFCTLIRQFTYRLIWRPESHLDAGTEIELRSHCLRAFISWRYTEFLMRDGDITFRWKVAPNVSERLANRDRVLMRACLPYGVRKGTPVIVEMTAIPPIWAGIDNTLSLWTVGGLNRGPDEPRPPAQRETGSSCTLQVVAGPVERLSLWSRPMPGSDGKVRTAIVPTDRFGNPGRFEQAQAAHLRWCGADRRLELLDTTIVDLEAPDDIARAELAIPMHGLAARENVGNARREAADLVVTGNPVWPVGPDGLRAGFGEFHWHTEFSRDGQRTIDQALGSARDALNMDFCAPGDHNPDGAKWQATVAALDAYNHDDHFATFFGWEYSQGRGHENYYFPTADHPVVCTDPAGFTGVEREAVPEHLDRLYAQRPFLTIPHHTNAVAETRRLEDDVPFWHPYKWGAPKEHLRLVEIFQCRGNQERDRYDDAWRGWHQGHHAAVQDALADGHRLGFVGGTDNHCGWPGRAFAECEGLGLHPAHSVILTGAWMPRLERGAVYDALCRRRTWAVWDTRALVYFTVNGVASGSEIRVAADTAAVARIRLSAEDALQSVELVADGAVLWQSSFAELDLDIEVPLPDLHRHRYVYLRALQRDGGIIYASPVFVTTEPDDNL